MVKRIWIVCLLFCSLPLLAECLTPDICNQIESIEMVLLSDSFSESDLQDYKKKVEEYIQDRERYYRELNIINPDIVKIKAMLPLLASKIALADCGESGEVMAGAVKDELCYPCMANQFEGDGRIDNLASNVNDIEEAIIANIAQEKLAESALGQMITLCDEGDALDVRACVEGEFGHNIPIHIQEKLDELMRSRGNSLPNKNAQAAQKVNALVEDLSGGDYCPEAANLIARDGGGIQIDDWTLENNDLVDLDLALQKCSPLKAMSLIETLSLGTQHQGWDFAEKEVFDEGFRNLYRAQHSRAHKMLSTTLEEVGSSALGGRVYDCLSGFPPAELSTHGNSVGGISGGSGKCKNFDADDLQKAREDAIGIVAKELKDKDNAKNGERALGILGTKGNDALFLAEMAHDNPQVLGQILVENLQNGDSCVGHICDALQKAKEIERKEKTRATIRRIAVTGVSIGSAILAFTPAAPGAAAMAGIAASVSIASAVSAGIDRAKKADEVRSLKFKLMGEQGDVSPEEWERLKGLEKELDMLTIELAAEIGLGAIDIVQFLRLAGVRNMDEGVDLLRGLKGSSKAQIDEFISACRR